MAEYTLPDLGYDYAALEPHISGEINQLHHGKHHATYVKGLNDAIAKLDEARQRRPRRRLPQREEPGVPPRWPRQPFDLVEEPVPQRRRQTHRCPRRRDRDQFGSFDKFRAQFTAAANGLQGSGWAVLGYDSLGQRLLTFQLYDQQANVPLGIIPLLQVDMWEHAYYLQYKNVKADYVKAFWNVVNWADVQDRFAAATNKTQGLIF
jgi:Fe-Mn family superoxide dismutase